MGRIAIIGAGITGLTAAQMLSGLCKVTLYESASTPGGLIRCREDGYGLFHTTGGHVFNTKISEVSDWFWSRFDREHDFVKTERNASIVMHDGSIVGYPMENHVYQLSDEILMAFVCDLTLMMKTEDKPTNFKDFLIGRFGKTLYDIYFQPYNRKVWHRELSQVPLSWLEGKLPMPSVSEMIYNNIRQIEEREFVHSTFYYPRIGGSQYIADTLAHSLDIRYNTTVSSISLDETDWIVEGERYDKVIFTGNVKILPELLGASIDMSGFEGPIAALESHGTTSVFCEIDYNPYSWLYLPSGEYDAHRIICTGNFSPYNNKTERLTATVEFTDYIDKDEMLSHLSRMPLSPRYISHNYAKYTYPIQSRDTREMVQALRTHLRTFGVHLIGRFAEWEYYNMDAAIASVLQNLSFLSA